MTVLWWKILSWPAALPRRKALEISDSSFGIFINVVHCTLWTTFFMNMPWISSEYPMKTAKLNFMALFLAMNFPWKGNFLFNDSRISYDQRFMSPEFSMKTCHRVFHGPWNHGTRLSDNWIFHELISSMSWAMKP